MITRLLLWAAILIIGISDLAIMGTNGHRLFSSDNYLIIVPGKYCVFARNETPIQKIIYENQLKEPACRFLSFIPEKPGMKKITYSVQRYEFFSTPGFYKIDQPAKFIYFTQEERLMIAELAVFATFCGLIYFYVVGYIRGFASWGNFFLFLWAASVYYRKVVWSKRTRVRFLSGGQKNALKLVFKNNHLTENAKFYSAIEAGLWLMNTGSSWNDLPSYYDDPSQCEKNFVSLINETLFSQIIDSLSTSNGA